MSTLQSWPAYQYMGHPSCVETCWNMMAHAQKPDFVFRRNGRVHLNRRGRQFSRLLAAAVCASAVVMLNTQCFEVVWRVLATHSIRQFPLHFPSRASPCAITLQLESTTHSLISYTAFVLAFSGICSYSCFVARLSLVALFTCLVLPYIGFIRLEL